MELVAQRQFNTLYIILDIAFLILLGVLLLLKKKYTTFIVAFLAGILYFIVDFGIFHLLTGSRVISEGHSLWAVLLWMSLSYGFTNFVMLWLWIRKDKDLLPFTFLILLWWFAAPLMANTFGQGFDVIVIQRTTSSYHGYMALILFFAYLSVIVWNLFHSNKIQKAPLLWLLAIGILVQFGWELGLLLGGIRSALFESFNEKLRTLVINSLLETNLGAPLLYWIFIQFNRTRNEDLSKRDVKLTFVESIEENNSISYKNS